MKIAGSRMLLVEDEPIIGFALEDMMQEAGAQTSFAASLEEALRLARTQAFDGAVIDVNLHGQESYPLAREALQRGVAVIFATGYGKGARPADLADVPTVAKPYDIHALRAAFAALG